MICFFVYGCGDYQSGYRDGHEGINKKQWIVFGKTGYLNGFQVGEAEKFQQDWFSENMTQENGLRCPDIIVRADPLMFLPPEYKRITPDIYQID